jgi:hypothetical protein
MFNQFWKKSLLGALSVAAVLVAGSAGTPGASASACSTSTPFAQFGDTNSYALLIQGSIENGLAGFQHTGHAAVAAENESYYVNNANDTKSLQLATGDSAKFHAGCLPRLNPSMRFFARSVSGTGSLRIQVRYKDTCNVVHTVDMPALQASDYASWTPTPVLPFLNTNKSLKGQTHGQVYLILKPSSNATWLVDDLYIDPYVTK